MLAIVGLYLYRNHQLPELPDRTVYKSLAERSEKALDFAKRHGMNEHYALFVDYGIASGTPRLFIWDFKKKEVIGSCHVMHGTGGGSTAEQPQFSNKPGSNCSALGRFLVTKDHGTELKKSFRLKGMDIDNQSAYARGLMIHPAKWVNIYRYKKNIPLNEVACRGCVTVSSRGMDKISSIVNKEERPLLLWNYYDRQKTQ